MLTGAASVSGGVTSEFFFLNPTIGSWHSLGVRVALWVRQGCGVSWATPGP